MNKALMDKTKKYSAPALDKGLDIIEYLSSESAARSQAEIAAGLERSPNEIYRILVNLQARGYLSRDESSGKYRLSLKLYALSHTHSPIEQLANAARLPLQELAETIGQACHLSVPYNGRLMVVSQVKSPDPVSLSISEGTLFPLFTTTSGRVLLANFDKEEQERLLLADSRFSGLSIKEQQQARQKLQQIRDEGHHSAASEITNGVTDCAAFVGTAVSGLMAAVAVSSLTTSLGQHHDQETITQALINTAAHINQRMGL
ncbi:IclR family transcriptional regulator [Gilvimarinus agarilyticus]|uniref:IclR family transcriptional regulator n=1 Tax=Gilvimarinus sp. 2_MG-2023 TaxID=3062666 RepID=UPI001C08DAD1|nr:IclR family transcriptional regulator [Gilvimarinus sp. 2_MG-2023]MBU2887728.1 IclR family transcriptional regulator [Gilvimarinus agarilyticus]MDO6572375.1 IclR family transcriptional regulator [Gilvimarinus sp. 2_MG-2023]